MRDIYDNCPLIKNRQRFSAGKYICLSVLKPNLIISNQPNPQSPAGNEVASWKKKLCEIYIIINVNDCDVM